METADIADIEAAAAEEEAYRDLVLKMLKEGEVALDFTKADGTNRKMRATLNPELIAANGPLLEVKEERTESLYHQPVYDLDKRAWRAFRWNRLISAAGTAKAPQKVH